MNRRSYFKLLATFKFVHGFLYCPGGYFLYKQTPNLRISHTKQLVQPFARCTAGSTKCRTPGSYSVCAVRTLLGINRKILSIRKEPMLSGFSHSKCSVYLGIAGLPTVVARLSWLSGRVLEAQARGVLGSTLVNYQPIHFPLFSPHPHLNSFISSMKQNAQ